MSISYNKTPTTADITFKENIERIFVSLEKDLMQKLTHFARENHIAPEKIINIYNTFLSFKEPTSENANPDALAILNTFFKQHIRAIAFFHQFSDQYPKDNIVTQVGNHSSTYADVKGRYNILLSLIFATESPKNSMYTSFPTAKEIEKRFRDCYKKCASNNPKPSAFFGIFSFRHRSHSDSSLSSSSSTHSLLSQ